jgi:hypothetical protein
MWPAVGHHAADDPHHRHRAFCKPDDPIQAGAALPADIAREFIERTHYKIVTDPKTADAVLDGAVLNFLSYPIIADQATGRATVVQCSAYLKVTLTERATGKVLFTRPSFEARERYEISVDPQAYFDESGAGIERLGRDVARDVVTSILEKF